MSILKSEYIRRKLSYIKSMVEDDTKQKLYDINTTAEYMFMFLLNDVYGWQLVNANDDIHPNFPAIDLIDTTKKIVIQVTSSITDKKVVTSIEKFAKFSDDTYKDGAYKKYAHYQLKMFYIKEKPNKFTKATQTKIDNQGMSDDDFLGIEDINRKVSANLDITDRVYRTLTKLFDTNSPQQINLTKIELEAQRAKEEKLIFSTTPKSKPVYINRKIDSLFFNRIAQKKACVLFLHGQGGMGKSTLLEKFSKTGRPTIFIQINEQVEMSIVSIFLNENKTTAHNCPKFEAKLNEIFIEQKNDKEIPFNAEFELLEAIREDFGEHGVFIVDTFEKNKNSRIRSSVKFDNHTVRFSRTESHQRFRDYLNSLVHLFVSHTTFIIAGRNRIDDVNESRSDEKFLNIDNVEELEMKKFSSPDIEQYIQEHKLEFPTQKQLTDIENLTHGNPLILSLLVKVASEYDGGWEELTNDEMKKIVYEDENYGLIYYFTKRILSHIDRVDIWKLIVPRVLSKEIEPLLFGEQKIFKLLVDVGLLYRGKGKERNIYTLHDDVYNAIEAYARKELQVNNLSWHDNDKVQTLHQKLKEFYQINKDSLGNYKFDVCYHNMMMKKKFELDFNRDRKVFIQSFLGAIFVTYKQKILFCKEFNKIDENNIKQTITKIEGEIKGSLSRMSKELYQECSSYVSQGISENGIYVVEFLESLLSKYQKQQDLFQIYSFLGQTYQNKQEYEKARKVYVDAVKRGLEDEDFFYLLIGNTYYYQDNNKEALFNYKLSAKINQKRDETFNNIGAVYYRMGEYDKAFEFYKKAINLKPTDSNYMNIASIFYEKKEYDIAIELYQKAISLNPYNEWAYINMANCYRDKRPPNYKEAFEIYKEASEINSSNEYVYNHSGILLFRKKQYKDAISAYQMAINKNPKNEWFYRNIGEVYYKLENSDKAIEYYQKAIAINPNESNFYNDMGLVFLGNKFYKKAIDFFQKAIEIDSNDVILYNNLGDAYAKNKEYRKSISCYEKSLKIKKNYQAQFYGAKVYLKQKKYVSAMKIYEQLEVSYPRYRISIYKELYVCYFYNHEYILMFKTMKKQWILKNNRYKSMQYRKKKEQEETMFQWFEKRVNLSRKKIKIIVITLVGIVSIGFYWTLYFIGSKIINFFT